MSRQSRRSLVKRMQGFCFQPRLKALAPKKIEKKTNEKPKEHAYTLPRGRREREKKEKNNKHKQRKCALVDKTR